MTMTSLKMHQGRENHRFDCIIVGEHFHISLVRCLTAVSSFKSVLFKASEDRLHECDITLICITVYLYAFLPSSLLVSSYRDSYDLQFLLTIQNEIKHMGTHDHGSMPK